MFFGNAMITILPYSSAAITAMRRCTRPLLALPLCLLLTSCDSASSSTTANNTTKQGAQTTNTVALADLQDIDVQNNLTDAAVNETNNAEGQSLIAAANSSDNSRRAPIISAASSDSSLQATLMGDYGGVVPCASCDNIEVTLNLFADGSVLKTSVFNDAAPTVPPLLESGVYRQDDDKITIVYERKNIETYKISDNHLIMMDADANLNDDYTLSRK